MGKDWLSWVGGGGGGGGGGNSRSSTKRGKMGGEASGGCMYAVFHLFHVHQFHLPSIHRNHSNTYPFLQEEATTTTGVEAPRNSLELNEMAATKQEEDLNFPVGIKIKTSKSRVITLDEISSECDSPGTKTPSVVARLMGLDLLPQPQCTSPSLTKSRKDTTLLQIDAARSLPETPRTSSSSRKSDVERHRLSLQINKEKAFFLSDDGGRRGRFKQDEKRIRSVGLDITNVNRNSDQSKKNSKKYGEEEVKQANAPRFKRNSSSYDTDHQLRRVSNQIPLKESKKVSGKCKRLPARAAASRREGGFVGSRERNKSHLAQNKCKRPNPLPCDILNVNGRVKIGGATPLTKLPQKQSRVYGLMSWKSSTQLSSKPSQSYNQLQLRHDKTPCSTNGGASPEQRKYIQILLNDTGNINQVNPIAKWHAPSQPINNRIFHRVELKAATGVSHRCERKLICVRDSLIEKDLRKPQWDGFWGEEEKMVREIEGEIVEWLVREAVAVMGGDAAEELVFGM